ncbi:hypothetical protein LI951_12920 [Enterococcus sp. BWT-B8]|uniref:hypothetical protein n=1 Tax=Enterococcus sp. BWT-B8 TaxID=2885157 RepID=UPI001E33BD9B|nr:hypothetical protein [Enterococcus sp. BWT-B8]MCB5952972.1 hypothetical protein [Enterococcus sp. BWT-B8]
MELIYNLKRNGLLILLKSSILLLLLFLLYIFFSFSSNINRQLHYTVKEGTENKMFAMVDTLFDPDDFYNFRQSRASLETVKTFYNLLNRNEALNFASSFDQPLQLKNFRGGIEFNERYGMGSEVEIVDSYLDPITNITVSDIKAFQMNKHFFDFYNIQLEQGSSDFWHELSLEQDTLPILLGADYKKIYNLNEVLSGIFYTKEYKFKVAGFLEKDTSVFYKNDINKYLDNYIIVPYPEKLLDVTESNKEFLGILYFAMIGGDIIIKQGQNFDYLNNLLSSIAKKSDFYDYTLLDIPAFTLQYHRMYGLINTNRTLLYWILIFITLSILNIMIFLTYKIYNQRRKRYAIAYFNGESIKKIKSLLFNDVVFGNVLVSLIFSFCFLVMPIKNMPIFLIVLLSTFGFLIFDYSLMVMFLKKDVHLSFSDFY